MGLSEAELHEVEETMTMEMYTEAGGRRLRCGFTTGSCAALAASGAVQYLLTGQMPPSAAIVTPSGVPIEVFLEDNGNLPGKWAAAGVAKDAGDDADVTDGLHICVRAEWVKVESPEERLEEESVEKRLKSLTVDVLYLPEGGKLSLLIDGGEGVGRVTLPGLDQPVGQAAINRVPRQMIRKAAEEAFATVWKASSQEAVLDEAAGLLLTVFVPKGAEAAKRTFNEKLGIVGGISILGTTGIVKPMSLEVFAESVRLEVRQQAALGEKRLVLVPGNYGLEFLRGFSLQEKEMGHLRFLDVPVVVCSNFIGECLDEARADGFSELRLVGHVGKLVKLAGGIMNTHSRFADCRVELFAAHAAICGAGRDICRKIMAASTTDACIELLKCESAELYEEVMHSLLVAMEEHLVRRVAGAYKVGAVMFSNAHGLLGMTEEARQMLERWGTTEL